MATLVLGAVGAAVGGSIGGSVLGMSGAVLGRAAGSTLGRILDQSVLGAGSQAVEHGRVDRFRLASASEGGPIPRVFGNSRVGGQVIWASRFLEKRTVSGGGGKGGGSRPTTTSYSYSVSLAVALCEGEISRVGRIWADGIQLEQDEVTLRVHTGADDQLPDSLIEAMEGAGAAPSYPGTAYVVFENLELGPFGNRVPQFSFEVVRAAQPVTTDSILAPATQIEGIALIPGTGEYALATTPLHVDDGLGATRSVNVNTPSGQTDVVTSLEAAREEMPKLSSVSLVVSWFGDDLRCGSCSVKPKVEPQAVDAVGMPWAVAGLTRGAAEQVAEIEGRAVYGGTPTDASVLEAIAEIKSGGQEVLFYPFMLMDQVEGNGTPNPWNPVVEQPPLPWRGRITASVAPLVDGSVDGTAALDAEVAAFFGTAAASDFAVSAGAVVYSGPAEWGYRRFILHNAALCAAAGGVEAFCIGSEMPGLTTLRNAANAFPSVAALQALAGEVRVLLPDAKIGYAADWTEYFGYHPQDGSGDVYYHLDPLWADANIDFIGIDNYMPMSDWRDGRDHADADFGAIYNLDYLRANIEGGEGYDWYYPTPEARIEQRRIPITDGAHGEPWVFRYKDIRNWWELTHHERVGGVRSFAPTVWEPRSKPIWFTEIGCAAIDKGTNQPNRFLDPKSAESGIPHYSNGRRDDLIQTQYLRALYNYWADPANNPVSIIYGEPMLDLRRAHVWAWDARPWPAFPNLSEIWADGENHAKGHWISGRTAAQPLSAVVAEICEASGILDFDVSQAHGFVRGYGIRDVQSGRADLQPLLLAYGLEVFEKGAKVVFRQRDLAPLRAVSDADLAVDDEGRHLIRHTRVPQAETTGRVRVVHETADGLHETAVSEAVHPGARDLSASETEVSLALTRSEGMGLAERWLSEARIARDRLTLSLPPSRRDVCVGDILDIREASAPAGHYRVDRIEDAAARKLEVVKVDLSVFQPSDETETRVIAAPFVPPLPVSAQFMDLPLLTENADPVAPYIAVSGSPWPGSVAVYSAFEDAGYTLNATLDSAAVQGRTLTALPAARPAVWDNGPAVRVQLSDGALTSASDIGVFAGANAAAIGDGVSGQWEVFQFREAVLVGPNTYDLTGRLRGQRGTEFAIADPWPEGSVFVLLDGAVEQLAHPPEWRGLARHYRVGAARRGYDDPSYRHFVEAFEGNGLRPYAPVHLVAVPQPNGAVTLRWTRRTRLDGDSWAGADVPLSEASEQYLVRVRKGADVQFEATVFSPEWVMSAGMFSSFSGGVTVDVAQVSERYGAGPVASLVVS